MVLDRLKPLEELTLGDFEGWPRASSWIPRHKDIRRIADYMKSLSDPKVLDVGCGNGIISALLANEGLDVQGVSLISNGDSWPYLSKKYGLKFLETSVENGKIYKGKNVIFNCWMPLGMDWSGYFRYCKPAQSMIIYVKSDVTGLQPGMPGNFNGINTYATYPDFVEVDRWKSFGNTDFEKEGSNTLTGKTSEVIVLARKEVYAQRKDKFSRVSESKPEVSPYNWEKDMPEI